MFTKIMNTTVVFAFVASMAGCASTTIYPEGKNSFSLVTTSSQQGYAEKAAKNKAEQYCQKQGKSLVVLKHKTIYQGPNKTDAAVIGLASAILTNGDNPADRSDNYQVTLKFTCR